MRSESELAVSTAVITLMRGVVYRESHEAVWQGLLRHGAPVRDHFATIGVDVVLDETEGYAYLRSRDEEDALPRLVQRRSLSYPVSLLLVLLGGMVLLGVYPAPLVDAIQYASDALLSSEAVTRLAQR